MFFLPIRYIQEAIERVTEKNIEELTTWTVNTPELNTNNGSVDRRHIIKNNRFFLSILFKPKITKGIIITPAIYLSKEMNE